MDENKLARLREAGYKINGACGICVYGQFEPGSQWGTCIIRNYKHIKHSGPERKMSVNVFGRCKNDFSPNAVGIANLGTFLEFFNDFR